MITFLQTQLDSIISAINNRAKLLSPNFTGTPTVPTASIGTNTTQIASTAFVLANTAASASSANCKIWMQANASNGVPTLVSGFGVSSLGDNGIGDITMNFTTAMPHANYAYIGSGKRNSVNPNYTVIVIGRGMVNEATTTSLRVMTTDQVTGAIDMEVVNVAIFG